MPSVEFNHPVSTVHDFEWRYETDEFDGVCELAHDAFIVKCAFSCTGKKFYDVVMINGVIKAHLLKPTTVERLADHLSEEFPDVNVSVSGRSRSHGWITATAVKRWPQ